MSGELAPIVGAEREGEPRDRLVHRVAAALEAGCDTGLAHPGRHEIEDVLVVLVHVGTAAWQAGEVVAGDQTVHGAEGGEMGPVVRIEHATQLSRARVGLRHSAEGVRSDVGAAPPGRDQTEDRQIRLFQENRRGADRRCFGRGIGRISRRGVDVFAD
ncbi:hypothetical protein [Streptomyces sp. NPDC046909]|uniref:hypothetical protein n=1 Tax=Streptomyces sp. NPDC046909 TaxID=3155617 RepID=UPI0033E261D2